MAALSEHTNVYNTALLLLQRKGYQLWYDAATEDFCAEKDGFDFRSPSPCGLLGLIGIYEMKKPAACEEYWWREGGPDLYRSLPNKPQRDYVPAASDRRP